jgi:hypothetical protein
VECASENGGSLPCPAMRMRVWACRGSRPVWAWSGARAAGPGSIAGSCGRRTRRAAAARPGCQRRARDGALPPAELRISPAISSQIGARHAEDQANSTSQDSIVINRRQASVGTEHVPDETSEQDSGRTLHRHRAHAPKPCRPTARQRRCHGRGGPHHHSPGRPPQQRQASPPAPPRPQTPAANSDLHVPKDYESAP